MAFMLLRVYYVLNSCLKTKQSLCLSVYIWFQLLLSIISWGRTLQDIVSFFTFLDWRELLGAIPKFSRVSRSSDVSNPHGAIIHFSTLLFSVKCAYFSLRANIFHVVYNNDKTLEFHPFTMLRNLACWGNFRYSLFYKFNSHVW